MQIRSRTFSCTRDGLVIRGTEYRSRNGKLPVAVVSHGFMANQRSVRRYARELARWGFAAYCFDFCGGCLIGKSSGRTTDMTVFTEQADLETVIAYAQSLPDSDPQHLVLMGCSQGGFVSALAAAKMGAQVEKLILFYPALCIPDDARAGRMMFAKFDPASVPSEIRCGPMRLGREYAASVQGMDPFAAISPYPGPVLVVHGTADRIVNFRYAEQAADAYEERITGHCTLVPLKGAGHGFSRGEDARVLPYVRRFLMEGVQ